MSLLTLSFALCDKSRRPLARLAGSNLPVNFGNMSFSFYMLHGVILVAVARMAEQTHPSPPTWIRLSVTLTLCVMAAWLSHRYIERPAMSRSKEPHA